LSGLTPKVKCLEITFYFRPSAKNSVSNEFFGLIIYGVDFFSYERELYFYSFIAVIGTLLTPLWFFQGTERMIVITGVTFLVRLILAASIFVLVTESSDYKFYALLNSISTFSIGIISFLFLSKKITLPNKANAAVLLHELKEGSILFVSNLAINLYTVSNTFILGLFAPPIIVGYWSAADKMRMAVQNMLMPFTQGMYPHLSKLFNESIEIAMRFIKKLFSVILLLSLTLSIMLFFFAEPIVSIILGDDYLSSGYILKIISFLPFIITLSNIAGIQILLNIRGSKEFTFTVLIAAGFNIVFSLTVVPKMLAIGTAVSVLITEVIVTMLMFYFAHRKLKKIGGTSEI
ncbi:MAG: polysaccharide transporter PST family, partial [Ignavibacteria bacterium]